MLCISLICGEVCALDHCKFARPGIAQDTVQWILPPSELAEHPTTAMIMRFIQCCFQPSHIVLYNTWLVFNRRTKRICGQQGATVQLKMSHFSTFGGSTNETGTVSEWKTGIASRKRKTLHVTPSTGNWTSYLLAGHFIASRSMTLSTRVPSQT